MLICAAAVGCETTGPDPNGGGVQDPAAETASKTLREALPSIDTAVAGATPQPVPVGTDGTIAVGTSPDGTEAATLLLFTHGPALARLEFQSALGDATTDQFVINIGKMMQQIALRTGLR